jgi:peptidoglycan/LPS O-acetylase OafA/YrhL
VANRRRQPVRHGPDHRGRRRHGAELSNRLAAAAPSGRRIGLDLVRAAAILFVLASHCGDIFANWLGGRAPEWLSVSGFFGVELFFVLSGFLIGRLLLGIIAEPPSLRA